MGLLNYFKIIRDYARWRAELGCRRMREALKRPELSIFLVWENPQDFVVIKRIRFKDTTASMNFIIKRFPKGDDLEYARLCANELLDELNKEI